jgi:hypothetical protein
MRGITGRVLHKDEFPHVEVPNVVVLAMRNCGPEDEGIYRAPHIGLVQHCLTIRVPAELMKSQV